MKKKIKYSNKNSGEIKIIKDFLPMPQQLMVKKINSPKIDFITPCKAGLRIKD